MNKKLRLAAGTGLAACTRPAACARPAAGLPTGGIVLAVMVASMLAGCRVVPYDSKFMCEKSRDYGRCMDVQSAYEEARAASASANSKSKSKARDGQDPILRYPPASTGVTRPLRPLKPSKAGARSAAAKPDDSFIRVSTQDLYRDAEYRELAGLIEAPVTPLIRPAKALRTLIIAYNTGDSLFLSRYVVYFADEPRFVMGDYLNPPDTSPTVYPMGQKKEKDAR